MSVSRQTTCLLCTFKQTIRRQTPAARRRFHVSAPVRSSADEKDPIENFKPLSKQEIKDNYSPDQQKAIELTQKNLEFSQKFKDGTTGMSHKPWTMDYMQQMTEIDPVLDKPVRQPWSSVDPNLRLKTEDELDDDIANFMHSMPENEAAAADAFTKFIDNNRITVGKESAEFTPRSALSTDNTKVFKDEKSSKQKKTAAKTPMNSDGGVQGTEEVSPALVRLMQMTGFDKDTLRQIRVKSVVSHRVVNQTRLGKIQKQYWLSIAGNQKGLLGVGEGKSEESAEGMLQSQYRAIRNMAPIMRYENRTIYGEVNGKAGATELHLTARPPGFGLRCQHLIWEMCRCAGIHDLSAKVTRARNPMNTVKAAYKAMMSQKNPEEIAKGRGKKLVDVRKVYYAGNT